jgi:hypothetical protein
MLFADEKPLPSKVEGTSGFAEKFSSEGPKDSQGRSLRQFDLERRLMKCPCSYMIYSSPFDALPDDLKGATYGRMWRILSGEERGKMYAGLTLEDCRAIVEILRETKRRLPEYFQAVKRSQRLRGQPVNGQNRTRRYHLGFGRVSADWESASLLLISVLDSYAADRKWR